MKNLLFILLILLSFSCNKKQDLTVNISVKGLKKGTLYLKKISDTTLITLDSVIVRGEKKLQLQTNINEPELLYIQLNKQAKENETIAFFAEKGITNINTTLKNFQIDAEVSGSEQQKLLEQYLVIKSRYTDKNLDLIKAMYEAKIANNTAKLDSVEKKQNSLVTSLYLNTVNFAIHNKNSEIAPYLALTEIADAQIKWLDTINKQLTPKVKNSLYGKQLDAYIQQRKKQ